MKEVRLGIIGVNGRGRLWQYWHHPDEGVTVAAGADTSQDSIDKFLARCNPDAFVTKDYRELLTRDDLDGIVVATPDYLHGEMVVAALDAGKFVYCEKPLAVTVEECHAIRDASERHPGKLMIGFNMRYMPFVRKMKELVDAGEIGEIKAVWVRHFVGMGSIYYFHDWHADKKNVGSLLLQKGSHDIDVIHFITGHHSVKASAFGGLEMFGGDKDNKLACPDCELKDTCIESQMPAMNVDAKPERKYCVYRKEVNVPDNYTCMFQLDNGVPVSYNECHFTPDYHRNYTFIGTKGRIENSEIESTVKLWKRGHGRNDQPVAVYDMLNGLTRDQLEIGHGGADPQICAEFVRLIRGEISEPSVPPEAGWNAALAGLAAQYSLEHGGMVGDVK